MPHITMADYNKFLSDRISKAPRDIDRKYIVEEISRWFTNYYPFRLLTSAYEDICSMGSQRYYVYLDSLDLIAHATQIRQLLRKEQLAYFCGYIVDESLYPTFRTELSDQKVFTFLEVHDSSDTLIYSLSESLPNTKYSKCISNSFTNRFVDTSPYQFIVDARKEFPEHKFILYLDYKNVQTISSIAGHISNRSALAFKTIGLVSSHNIKPNTYDYIIAEPYLYLWPLIVNTFDPDIFHLNVGWGTQGLPFAIFIPDTDRTVVDFYDIVTFISDNTLRKHHPEDLALTRSSEKYLIQNFSNTMHRFSNDISVRLKKEYGYHISITAVNEYMAEPVYSNVARLSSDRIHLAFGGDTVNSLSRDDPYYERFIELVKYFAQGNLSLYLYPNPFITNFKKSVVLDTLIADLNLNNVYSCTPLTEDMYIKDISKFDFGIIGVTPEVIRPMEYGYGLPFKFISYLRAGLPIITLDDFTAVAEYVKQYNIGVVFAYSDRTRIPELLNNLDIRALKTNVVKFRHNFGIDIGAGKVIDIYQEIFKKMPPVRSSRKSFFFSIQSKTDTNDDHMSFLKSDSREVDDSITLNIPETGFISFEDYNRFLTKTIQQADHGLDKDYVTKELNEWLASYLDYQILARACSILSSLSGKSHVIYIGSVKAPQFLIRLSNAFRLDPSSGFTGFVVDDKMINSIPPQFFAGYPYIPASQFEHKLKGVTVFSPFSEMPPYEFPNLCTNDYLSHFIDVSRFAHLCDLRLRQDGRHSILYPLYREIHTVGILAGQMRKSLPHLFQTIALVGNTDLIEREYDCVIQEPFFYLWPLIFKIVDPDICHINVGWGIQALSLLPFIPDSHKTLIDFYEVLSFLRDSYFDKMHSTAKQVKSAEEYIFKNYDNIIHLCSEDTTSKLKTKYSVNSNIISVTEYLQEPTYCHENQDHGVIKLVYGGNMVVRNSPDDMMYNAFLKIVRYFAAENLYLHIYNSPYIHGFNFRNGLDDLIRDHKLTHVISCQPLKRPDFIKSISEFDYGVTLIRPKDMNVHEYNYFMAYKILTYFMAGLPVVIDADNTYMADLVREFGMGVVLKDDDYPNLSYILNNQNLKLLKENVVRHRDRFNIRHAVSKVARIYQSILSTNRDNQPKPVAQSKICRSDLSMEHSKDAHNPSAELIPLIDHIARDEKRLYYRDQTPSSLQFLIDLVHLHRPTRVIELGTLSGLSLRTWLMADERIKVTAIDLSFQALQRAQTVFPFDSSRVTLLEQDILKTDFSSLWSSEDSVIFYLDAHDAPGIEIMEHIIEHALPLLPRDSVFVVDDLWYSPTRLTEDNAYSFLRDRVLNEIDPLQCFSGYFAPYWEGGSFMGFAEVIPLMRWVNENRIKLSFVQGVKSVMVKLTDSSLRK